MLRSLTNLCVLFSRQTLSVASQGMNAQQGHTLSMRRRATTEPAITLTHIILLTNSGVTTFSFMWIMSSLKFLKSTWTANGHSGDYAYSTAAARANDKEVSCLDFGQGDTHGVLTARIHNVCLCQLLLLVIGTPLSFTFFILVVCPHCAGNKNAHRSTRRPTTGARREAVVVSYLSSLVSFSRKQLRALWSANPQGNVVSTLAQELALGVLVARRQNMCVMCGGASYARNAR